MKNGLAAPAFAALLAACGGGSPAEVICDANCEQSERCGRTIEDCPNECVADNPGFARFSDSFADAVSGCIPEQTCSIDQERLTACIDSRLEPTDRTRSFCSTFSFTLFQCGQAYARERCELDFAAWSDSVMSEIEGCYSRPCEELDPCIEKVFDQ